MRSRPLPFFPVVCIIHSSILHHHHLVLHLLQQAITGSELMQKRLAILGKVSLLVQPKFEMPEMHPSPEDSVQQR